MLIFTLYSECPDNVSQFVKETTEGPIHLFFGCRNEHDFLYKDELLRREREGDLTTLDVAMSRLPGNAEKIYVTRKIVARGAELAKLLLQEGGYVYICGDGTKMAKDVYQAIKTVLQEHGSLSCEQTEEMLDEMKLRRRYVVDIWS